MLEITTLLNISPSAINNIYKNKSLSLSELPEIDESFWSDQAGHFFALKNDRQSALALLVRDDRALYLVDTKGLTYRGLEPRDAAQCCLFYSMKTQSLTVALGEAGTGKTTIALAYAVDCLYKRDMNIVLCKPTTFVGMKSNAIAAVPGDHREKMAGYIESYMGALRRLFGDTFEHHLYELEEQGRIIFQPLELVRGMQFENSVVIIDEAQNTTPHELMSVLSRIDESSRAIILGDPHQIDTRTDFAETGLGALAGSDAFLDCDFAAGISLTHNYRGPMAVLASTILKEYSERSHGFPFDSPECS